MNIKGIRGYLNKYENNYRLYDPAMYLYKLILDFKGYKFTDEFIELVYTTLKAWNMDSRGAKLSKYEVFKKSIKKNKTAIRKLFKYKLGKLNEEDIAYVLDNVKMLFRNLNLVAKGKPKLVTYSKTLHFFMPDLFMPIDRRYTLNYFSCNNNLHEKYLYIFEKIFNSFNDFANKNNLSKYIDSNRNRNIPKLIDNMIIGKYLKLNLN